MGGKFITNNGFKTRLQKNIKPGDDVLFFI